MEMDNVDQELIDALNNFLAQGNNLCLDDIDRTDLEKTVLQGYKSAEKWDKTEKLKQFILDSQEKISKIQRDLQNLEEDFSVIIQEMKED